jgi:PAS domain S-box-containing protein
MQAFASVNPTLLAIGVAAIIAVAYAAVTFLLQRNRALREQCRRLEARTEELADRNWELKDVEERARNFLEAQGDVIVRRDRGGIITYANDAFCALAGRSREALVGTYFTLPALEQRDTAAAPDGARVYDQKIATADGGRWIAWREVSVNLGPNNNTEIQSVGRDVTDRTEGERALAEARDQAEAANPRQVAIPRAGFPRDPDTADRNSRHGGFDARHGTDAGADNLCQGSENLGRYLAVIDRGNPGFLQDRGRQARY